MACAENVCDVLVIGGGPAGSTAAALLAGYGHKVVIFEKSKHPRFHIGESLLPMNMPLFDKLGVAEQIKEIGTIKLGAEFISPHHPAPSMIEFKEAWVGDHTTAYQVRRDQFDQILFQNALDKGALGFEECKVVGIEFQGDAGVLVTGLDKEQQETKWRTRFVVDASGRDTFLSNFFGIKHRNKKHNSAAIFGHFSGATRLPGEAQGNISVFWFEHGWFWFIPLSDGNVSIGATCWPYYMKMRETSLEQFLLDTIALCPALVERMKNAKLVSPVSATGNFSYLSERSSGSHYILLGDAYAFIDPVFSSGVFLAMNSAFAGADAVHTCLTHPESAKNALRSFDKLMQHGPKVFSWFIYRITTPAMRDLLMYAGPSRIKRALISVLIGDVFPRVPSRRWLFMFKAMYYLKSLANIKGNWMALRRRKQAIRAV